MKVFILLLFSCGLSFLTYSKNFKLSLFSIRSSWIFLLLNIIFHPVFNINVKENYKNIIIFDRTTSMNQKEKFSEARNFLNKIRGKNEIIYLDEKNIDNIIYKIKNKKISEILLLSDGYFPDIFGKFLENLKIPINVFMFPQVEASENIQIKVPSFVEEKNEFLIEINIFSKDSSGAEINIKGDGIDIKKNIEIKKGNNYFNQKFFFEKAGTKKIHIYLLKGNKGVNREYKINVLRKRPEVVIFCQRPSPLLKIIKNFLKENVQEDIKVFVELSKDRIMQINKFVRELEIPEKSDWFIVISPDFSKDYTKITYADKFFYFYEDTPSEKITGKGIIEGKNLSIELPVTEFRIVPGKIKGKEILNIKSGSKFFPIVVNKRNETHILLGNLFEILLPVDESLKNKVFDYIFKTSELENPAIIYYEIPERLEEKKDFFIKAFVLTPSLKPAYNSQVLLKINNKNYPMIYQGKGTFLSPPIEIDAGKHEFEIIAQKDEFLKISKDYLEVLPIEAEEGVDREYLSFLAKKTGGEEVYKNYTFKKALSYTKKYPFNLRKNLLSYILIALIFSFEIFLRKREGFL